MRRIILPILILITGASILPAQESALDLKIEPECYTAGHVINFIISISPLELQRPKGLELKMKINGENFEYSETLTSDRINRLLQGSSPADSIDLSGKKETEREPIKITCPYRIKDNQTGRLIITMILLRDQNTISIIQSFIHEESECKKIETAIKEPSIIDQYYNKGNDQPTDYRERLITGQIVVENTDWQRFPLTLIAENAAGGGEETTTINVTGPGVYQYRVGNLYPGVYRFRLYNYEDPNPRRLVQFDENILSRSINFYIPGIAPVNLGVYDLYSSEIKQLGNGKYQHQMKAYICRFDDSLVTNLRFNWRFGNKYYYDNLAPEKNRCLAFYPDPIVLNEGESIRLELEVNPVTLPGVGERDSLWKDLSRLYEVDFTDNTFIIEITGGKDTE